MTTPVAPPSDPEQPPTLTPDVVADDELLGEVVDEFVRRNRVARERLSAITDMQEGLRQSVDGETWRLALYVDEMVTERWAELAVEIAKWAFNEGVRSAAQPRGAT